VHGWKFIGANGYSRLVGKCYNGYMADFGKGPTLKEAFPWLRDDARIERIPTVTEINSVIEGLPPLDAETRQKIRRRLLECNFSFAKKSDG
jgi:hypothetical protein